MRYIVVSLMLLFTLLAGAETEEIVWQKDLESAVSLAKEQQLPLMVMVEGKRCRWCKKMRYRTLEDEAVTAKLQKYVNVRVDEENKEAMSHLPPVDGVPTIFFFSPQIKLLETSVGYSVVDDFLKIFPRIEQKAIKADHGKL